jgi:hypothetical protein
MHLSDSQKPLLKLNSQNAIVDMSFESILFINFNSKEIDALLENASARKSSKSYSMMGEFI